MHVKYEKKYHQTATWNNKGIMFEYHNKLYEPDWIFDTKTCVNVYYILSKVPSIYPPNIGCGCFSC